MLVDGRLQGGLGGVQCRWILRVDLVVDVDDRRMPRANVVAGMNRGVAVGVKCGRNWMGTGPRDVRPRECPARAWPDAEDVDAVLDWADVAGQ